VLNWWHCILYWHFRTYFTNVIPECCHLRAYRFPPKRQFTYGHHAAISHNYRCEKKTVYSGNTLKNGAVPVGVACLYVHLSVHWWHVSSVCRYPSATEVHISLRRSQSTHICALRHLSPLAEGPHNHRYLFLNTLKCNVYTLCVVICLMCVQPSLLRHITKPRLCVVFFKKNSVA
jgi:hypothetical protein